MMLVHHTGMSELTRWHLYAFDIVNIDVIRACTTTLSNEVPSIFFADRLCGDINREWLLVC